MEVSKGRGSLGVGDSGDAGIGYEWLLELQFILVGVTLYLEGVIARKQHSTRLDTQLVGVGVGNIIPAEARHSRCSSAYPLPVSWLLISARVHDLSIYGEAGVRQDHTRAGSGYTKQGLQAVDLQLALLQDIMGRLSHLHHNHHICHHVRFPKASCLKEPLLPSSIVSYGFDCKLNRRL